MRQLRPRPSKTGERPAPTPRLLAAAPALLEAVIHLRDAMRVLGYQAAPGSPIARSLAMADAAIAQAQPTEEDP